MIDLKPCPFCGERLKHDPEVEAFRHARHPWCPTSGFLFADDRRDVAAAWNTRTS